MFEVKHVVLGDNSNNYLVGNDTQQIEYDENGQIVISSADDAIYGYGGNDTLLGRSGDDDLYGGSGNDQLYGGNDDDRLYGQTGNDRLWGDAGDDLLDGGDGNDSVYGWRGSDTLSGGNGNDYLGGGALGENQSGYDRVTGGSGADYFSLQSNSFMHYSGNGYATITDFSRVEGDRIIVGDFGANNNNYYSLGTSYVSGDPSQLDTIVRFQGDWIAVVEDNTSISLASDFVFAPFVAG